MYPSRQSTAQVLKSKRAIIKNISKNMHDTSSQKTNSDTGKLALVKKMMQKKSEKK